MSRIKTVKKLLQIAPEEKDVKVLIIQTREGEREHKYLPIAYSNEKAEQIFDFINEEVTFSNVSNGKFIIQTVNIKMCFSVIEENGKEITICKHGLSTQLVGASNVNYVSQLLITEAKKNAYAQLGRAFGSELNRELLIEQDEKEKKVEEIVSKMSTNEKRVYEHFESTKLSALEKVKASEKNPDVMTLIFNNVELKKRFEEIKAEAKLGSKK